MENVLPFIWDLITGNLDVISGFLIGFVIKSPIYQTAKNLLKSLVKALEDDKLTKEEVNELIGYFKKDD